MPGKITLKLETAPLGGNGAEDEKHRHHGSTSINELRVLVLKSTYCKLSNTLSIADSYYGSACATVGSVLCKASIDTNNGRGKHAYEIRCSWSFSSQLTVIARTGAEHQG